MKSLEAERSWVNVENLVIIVRRFRALTSSEAGEGYALGGKGAG